MPNPDPLLKTEGDFMYSPPPPPHNLRWLLQRSLDMLVRLLIGVLLCALGIGLVVGLIALFPTILRLFIQFFSF